MYSASIYLAPWTLPPYQMVLEDVHIRQRSSLQRRELQGQELCVSVSDDPQLSNICFSVSRLSS
jgi:hypothetical protein